MLKINYCTLRNFSVEIFCMFTHFSCKNLEEKFWILSVNRFLTQMEFIVTNMEEPIDFTVFDSDMFSPNGKWRTAQYMQALIQFDASLTPQFLQSFSAMPTYLCPNYKKRDPVRGRNDSSSNTSPAESSKSKSPWRQTDKDRTPSNQLHDKTSSSFYYRS